MKNKFIKIIVGFFYVVMITVNFLANALPINNRSTGEISDAYSNLFAPAGPAFSIWGLIYLLLGGYVVYQFTKSSQQKKLLEKINLLFIVTSLANILWIFAWHYDYIGLSVFIMAVLLVALIRISDIIRTEQFTSLEKIFIWAPFSLYFGWITVAAIANIAVFLVKIEWSRFGIPDFIWTSIILLIGAIIGILRMQKDKNVVYGLVLFWAYLWIIFKHLSTSGFGGQYPSVIITAIACLILFLFFGKRIVYKNLSYRPLHL